MTMSKNKQNSSYDIVILGGGMAGITMALSLVKMSLIKVASPTLESEQPLQIAVIEKTAFNANQQSSFDDRCIALSAGSQLIYKNMGIWDLLSGNNEAIKNIHISEQGKMGFARLNHKQENVDALGYVVESFALGKVLLEQLQQYKNVDIFCPSLVKNINFSSESVSIELSNTKNKTETINCSLLIAADGSQSFCHQFLSTKPVRKQYQQCAIITNIETEYAHQGEAFERFTESGPLALLPLTKNRCSVVWTVKEKDVELIMSLTEHDFIQQLQQQFGYRLGKILHIGKRFFYPLSLMSLESSAVTQQQRLAFIGNAAHSIHPVTGQGFNLGLRDISTLTKLIGKNIQQHQGQFVYQAELIEDYWNNRETDINNVSRFTDSLIRLFSNQTIPLTPARNIALTLFELYQPLKGLLARFAMGLTQKH